MKLDYIYPELYVRRNRIMHWGDVTFSSDEASRAFGAACNAFAVLKMMDRERADELMMERQLKEQRQR